MTPQEQIKTLEALGITRYRIFCDTGINQVTLQKWVNELQTPNRSNKNVDILNEYYKSVTNN